MKTTATISSLVLYVVALSVLCLAGCKKQNIVECGYNEAFDPKLGICHPCPPGSQVDHSSATCVPDGQADSVGGDPDTHVIPDQDLYVADTGGDAATETKGPDSADVPVLDAVEAKGQDVVLADGLVGSTCNMDSDCDEDLTCFDWPGGYCILGSCDADEDCPEGSSCLPLLENGQGCFADCDGVDDCRPGYACKTIPKLSGESSRVCHPVADGAAGLSEPCEKHAECEGELGCVSMGSESLCTVTGCSGFDPCPGGADCIQLGVLTICLKTCVADGDCPGLLQGGLSCQETENLDGDDVSVCTPVQSGVELGAVCYFGTECASGYCHLLVSGTCHPTGGECATDQDCPEGTCVANPAFQKGVCSLPCGSEQPCPADAFCVKTALGPVCMPACSNHGMSCGPAGLGMFCTYGTLYYPAGAGGKYACVSVTGGDGGADCGDDNDCSSGTCYGPEDETGYCATGCSSDGDCQFGTLCLPNLGPESCLRICFSGLDCPAGFSCLNNVYSPEKTCLVQ